MTQTSRAAAATPLAGAWSDEHAIRTAAREVISGPDYDFETAAEPPSAAWLEELLRWLLAPIRWCFELMEGVPDGVRWLIIAALLVVFVLLIVHIVWSLMASLGPPRIGKLNLSSTNDVAVDPKELEAEARRLAAAGDYVAACRWLLLASIQHLQSIRQSRFRPGLTNTELLREYASTQVAEPLRKLVRTIDAKWYGDEPCHASDYEACDTSHARIRRAVEERRDAVSA